MAALLSSTVGAMPRALPAELPAPLLRLLDGEDLERKEGETLLLLTAAPDGWPRLALLSVGEVYAPSATEVRLALWPDSRTTANLAANGRATLSAIIDGVTYDVEVEARREGDVPLGTWSAARFAATVRSVRSDTVGYAEITSGVRYRLKDAPKVLERWRRQVAALREGRREEEPEPDGMD